MILRFLVVRKCLTIIAVLLSLSAFAQKSKVSAKNFEGRPSAWAKPSQNEFLDNYFIVNDSISRADQPDRRAFAVIDSTGYKSILSLRDDFNDAWYAGNTNLLLYKVEMRAGKFTNYEVLTAMKILVTSKKPILVHCRVGADRTGLIIAMYRILFCNWTREQAIDEMVNGQYNFHPYFQNIPEYLKTVDIDKFKEDLALMLSN